MSDDFILGFDDEITPPATTLPSGPAPSVAASGTEDDETTPPPKKKRNPKLLLLQQDNLTEDRDAFAKIIKTYRPWRTEYAKMVAEAEQKRDETLAEIAPFWQGERFIGTTHIAPWKDIWSLADNLQVLTQDIALQFTVILGGWLGADDKSEEPVPFSTEMLTALKQFGFYSEIVILGDKPVEQQDKSKAAIRSMIQQQIKPTADGLLDLDIIEAYEAQNIGLVYRRAGIHKKRLQADLEKFFLFMEHRRYWFFPTRFDMSGGWKDFYQFASDYNHMRPDFINDLGPYNFSIELAELPAPPAP
jgi:hypothetical protein